MISSIQGFIRKIKSDISIWKESNPVVWFRGQSCDEPLLPRLYRPDYQGPKENDLIQPFRMRGRAFPNSPEYSRIDEWLFLMQHSGLPTRLLDWTEGALIALFFALWDWESEKKYRPVVWLLNPKALNVLPGSYGKPILPLSWYGHGNKPACPYNIKAAFEAKGDEQACELPVALMPQHVHPRVTAQRSCFIIYGKKKDSLETIVSNIELMETKDTEGHFSEVGVAGKLFGEVYLRKYEINFKKRDDILMDLTMSGISISTLFPDLDGLAKELSGITSMH